MAKARTATEEAGYQLGLTIESLKRHLSNEQIADVLQELARKLTEEASQ